MNKKELWDKIHSEDLQVLLCLATLVANEELSSDSNLWDADQYFNKVAHGDCSFCPYSDRCMVCILDQ